MDTHKALLLSVKKATSSASEHGWSICQWLYN